MQHDLLPIRQPQLFCLVFAAILGAVALPAAAQDKILRWHDNLERAVQVARESGKPLFVVFRCVR